MSKIKGTMNILEVVYKYPQTEQIFKKYNLFCENCFHIRNEKIKDRAEFMKINVDKLLKELNSVVF